MATKNGMSCLDAIVTACQEAGAKDNGGVVRLFRYFYEQFMCVVESQMEIVTRERERDDDGVKKEVRLNC